MRSKRAQISLEFMAAVAIYLAFIFILSYTQNAVLQNLKRNVELIISSLDADYSNTIFSLIHIYYPAMDESPKYTLNSPCILIGAKVFCGEYENSINENSIARRSLYIGD